MMKKMIDGVIVPFSDDEIAQTEVDRNNYEQNILPYEIRAERNKLLADTDYLALSDNTMTSDMQSYRQALRDVTSQSGFPTTVTWPTKP
jgi:hypothetical protein